MPFAKGADPRRARGRPKGAQNKIQRDLREMILTALSQAGGVDYLVRQAKRRNPAPFMALVGKVLPTTIGLSGTLAGVARIVHEHRHSIEQDPDRMVLKDADPGDPDEINLTPDDRLITDDQRRMVPVPEWTR